MKVVGWSLGFMIFGLWKAEALGDMFLATGFLGVYCEGFKKRKSSN